MAEKVWDVGDRVDLSATFRDKDGALVSPDTVTLYVEAPGSAGAVLIIDPDNPSTGLYEGSVVVTVAGLWHYRFQGSGDVEEAESGSFTVRPSVFDAQTWNAAPADYFTVREFRAAIDPTPMYTAEQVGYAQSIVISRFESWAGRAFPNVDVPLGLGSLEAGGQDLLLTSGALHPSDIGRQVIIPGAGVDGADLVTVIDGFTDLLQGHTADAATVAVTDAAVSWGDSIGTATALRVTTEVLPWGIAADFTLRYRPVPSADITIAGFPLTESYVLDSQAGILHFLAGLPLAIQDLAWQGLVVTYPYGETRCPPAVKDPCMAATKSLLARITSEGKGSRMPRGVRSYTTDRTTLDFDPYQTLTNRPRPVRPWPWDLEASEDIAAVIGPRVMIGVL